MRSLKQGAKKEPKRRPSAAVAWARHGGLETTHLFHIAAFITLEMLPYRPTIASVNWEHQPLPVSITYAIFDKDVRLGVERDSEGLNSGSAMMKRAIELATLLKRGKGDSRFIDQNEKRAVTSRAGSHPSL